MSMLNQYKLEMQEILFVKEGQSALFQNSCEMIKTFSGLYFSDVGCPKFTTFPFNSFDHNFSWIVHETFHQYFGL